MLRNTACLSLVISLSACAANSLLPGAERIRLSQSDPGERCEYLGEVVGNQGNFISGEFTSNGNLEQGAVNDMKNQAHRRGATHLVLITNRAGVTGDRGGASRQTNVTMMGAAYRCPLGISTRRPRSRYGARRFDD